MATILVVDDDPANRQLIGAVFPHGTHRFIEAANGEEALRAAAEALPDVVVTDLYMPRMDGPRFVKELRAQAHGRNCEIVLYTATRADTPLMRDFMTMNGIRHVIEKPAEPQTIVERIGAALAAPEAR